MTKRGDSESSESDYADRHGSVRSPLSRLAAVIGSLAPILIAGSIVTLWGLGIHLSGREILTCGLCSLAVIPILMWSLPAWRGWGRGFSNWATVFVAAVLVWAIEVVVGIVIIFGYLLVWFWWR